MKISAKINNKAANHQVVLTTNDNSHAINIPAKSNGLGSKANGGELFFLALATCYCNDIYREAVKLNIDVSEVEVEVEGEFGGVGEAAKSIQYHARVKADADEDTIKKLMRHTDTVAEIQNTVRQGVPVTLASFSVKSD